ncbi:MAG: N-acetylmuramoyl-L-alanine amidase, partial [Patescibacteria group bacterium]
MKGPSTTKVFIIGTIAFLAVVFLSSQVHASSKQEIQKGEVIHLNVTNDTVSEVIASDFPFQMIGVAWQSNDPVELAVRYYGTNKWSDWYSIEETVKKDDWYFTKEPVISNNATKFQYSVISGNLDKLKLIYLGETRKLQFDKWNPIKIFKQVSAQNNLDIITRSEWEADEDWRLDGADKEIWPTEYQTPEKFVVHHTAGGDGGNDPEGTVRGIYYWHSVVLGWGDIGYNYLIDQDGKIYEGRFGGDGSIAAHVYRNKACAISRFGGEEFEADFNKGSIGISVLGDYEDMELNSEVSNALVSLIANKAQDFAIEPSEESFLVDDNYPNIVGHRDLDCTLCPGANLYQELDSIRSESQNLYDELGGLAKPVINASFVRQSTKSISINAGQEEEVWVEFKNTGNVTWRTYGQYSSHIIPSNGSSNLQASNWESQTHVTVADNSNIAPGETGR